MPLRFFLISCCVLVVLPLAAQWRLVPQTSLGYAWGGIETLDGRPARAGAIVGRTQLVAAYRKAKWEAAAGLGGKWLLPRGRFDEQPFRGRALRAILPVSLRYQLPRGLWIGVGYEVQNERDFGELERNSEHVLRHNAQLSGHVVRGPWAIGLAVHRTLSNNPATFYLADPRWSAGLTFAYRIGTTDD